MKFQEMKDLEPKIETMTESAKNPYRIGMSLMGTVANNIIDIPQLPADKFSTEGLFYEIPYLHSDILCSVGDKIDLLVVYCIQRNANGNMESDCPLRIEFRYESDANYCITIHDQRINANTGRFKKPITLIEKADDRYFSAFKSTHQMQKLTLTGLLSE